MAETTGDRGVNWGSAIIAGLVGAVAITITLALSGTNIMKMLGVMMLGSGASVAAQYMAGGLVHLMIGVLYGVVYAALFAPVSAWNKIIKGARFWPLDHSISFCVNAGDGIHDGWWCRQSV